MDKYSNKDTEIHKSPINYAGSKDTVLPEILKVLPSKVDIFVDVMGGAFNVGVNIPATKKVIYNEINPYVFELVRFVLAEDKIKIITAVEEKIKAYGLERRAKEQYVALRAAYNEKQTPLELFVLHMYCFQNMIRFNENHKFNTPIGVAGYNEGIKQRILNFKYKAPEVELLNEDYVNLKWETYPPDTVFYFDPPYIITSAAYNDGKRGMKGWSTQEELELLSILKKLDTLGHKFILSNVLKHKGKENTLLINWIKENGYKIIEAGVSGKKYSKNEVLILNYTS